MVDFIYPSKTPRFFVEFIVRSILIVDDQKSPSFKRLWLIILYVNVQLVIYVFIIMMYIWSLLLMLNPYWLSMLLGLYPSISRWNPQRIDFFKGKSAGNHAFYPQISWNPKKITGNPPMWHFQPKPTWSLHDFSRNSQEIIRFPWFSIVFPWFSHGFPHEMPVFHRAMARASPGHAAALSQRCADLAAKLSRERQRCPGNSVNQRSFGVKLAESAKSMDI